VNKKIVSIAALACCLSIQSVMAEAPVVAPHPVAQQAADAPLWSEQQQGAAELEAKYLEQIQANPDDKVAYANLANLYLIHNKSAKAISAYQEAIIHDSENPKLFAALSIAYLHQSKYSMAKAMADQAIKISPDMEQARKIQRYIDAKEQAIAQASASDADMPDDGVHRPAAALPYGSAAGAPHGSVASSPHGTK